MEEALFETLSGEMDGPKCIRKRTNFGSETEQLRSQDIVASHEADNRKRNA